MVSFVRGRLRGEGQQQERGQRDGEASELGHDGVLRGSGQKPAQRTTFRGPAEFTPAVFERLDDDPAEPGLAHGRLAAVDVAASGPGDLDAFLARRVGVVGDEPAAEADVRAGHRASGTSVVRGKQESQTERG